MIDSNLQCGFASCDSNVSSFAVVIKHLIKQVVVTLKSMCHYPKDGFSSRSMGTLKEIAGFETVGKVVVYPLDSKHIGKHIEEAEATRELLLYDSAFNLD